MLPSTYPSFEEEEQQQQPVQPVQPERTEAEMTPAEMAEVAQPVERPEGFFTQAGEALQTFGDRVNPINIPANAIDAAQMITDALGYGDSEFAQGLEQAGEVFKTQRELDEERMAQIQQIQAGETEGFTEGQIAYAGISPKIDAAVYGADDLTTQLIPSLGAAFTGQSAPWLNRPASIAEDDPLADTIYGITQVLAPSIIASPVLGALSPGAALTVESAVETAVQRSAADLLGGRTLAARFGEIYDAMELDLGYENGTELTKALIEGRDLEARAILGVWGFGQNYGINWSAIKLIEQFPAAKKVFTRGSEWIAEKLGKSVDEVEDALVNIPEAPYTSTVEPSQAATLNTVLPRAVAPDGNPLNAPGLLQRMLRDIEELPEVDRLPGEFMYNLENIVKAPDPRKALADAFADLPRIELAKNAKRRIAKKSLEWLIQNRSLLDTNTQAFIDKYGADFIINTDPKKLEGGSTVFSDLDSYIREFWRIGDNTFGQNEDAPYVGVAVARYILEDLGYQLQKLSSEMNNMIARDEDITPMMRDLFIPLERLTQTFSFPFRRAQRQFNLLGESLNRKLFDIDELTDIPQEELSIMMVDGTPTLETISSLWEAAQAGDKKSWKTLKTYLKNMEVGDPTKVISDNAISTQIIKEKLMEKDGGTKFLYNGMLLAQFGTQFNATVPTIFRQVFEPLALAGSFNPTTASADRIYGFGQFWGGMKYMNKSWNALFRALNTNKPAAGYAKYSTNYSSNLLQEQAQIKNLHLKLQLQMMEEGANFWERLHARAWGLWQVATYDPKANLASRGLMASDEGARVTTGIQVAVGRAWKDAHLGKIKPEQIEEQVQAHLKQIFKGDPSYANIRDPEVKALADTITMQTPLTIDEDSSLLEKYFAAEDAAAKMSPFHRFFSPFSRVAGATMQQEMASQVGMTGILQPFVGKGIPGLRVFTGPALPGLKKYAKLYQKSDPTQKLQLESQLALSQWLTLSTISTVLFGGKITGSVVAPGEPENAIIVPAPWTQKGEIAFPYSKFSPYGVVLNNIANTVREFQTGGISHEQYNRSVINIIYGYAAYSLNKAVLQGQQQLQKLLDFANFEQWQIAAVDTATSVLTPGVGRELGGLIDPRQTITSDRTSFETTVATGLTNQATGGMLQPGKYDIYAKTKTGPMTRYPQPEEGNGFQKRAMGLISIMFPGNVTETDYSSPVRDMFRASNYETYRNLTTRIGSAYLNLDQQSNLQQAMQGNLYPELIKFRNAQFKRGDKPVGLWRKYTERLKEFGPDAIQTQQALAEFNERLDDIHFKVRDAAIEEAGLNQDPVLQEQIEKVKRERLLDQISSAKPQGLFAQAAQQDTPLARQVRDILDIA